METMQNGDELVFLYQLVDGYTNTSYACHIATLAGISSDIVQRGHEVCTRYLRYESKAKARVLYSVDTIGTQML